MGSAVKSVGDALGMGKSSGFKARDAARKAKGPKPNKKVKKVKGAGEARRRYDQIFGEARSRQQDIQQRDVNLLDQLGAQAAGTGPSLAEAQLKAAQDRNLAQQLAAAGRGGAPTSAATQRQLLRNQATSGRQLAQDAAQARMQEQQAAQQQLVGALAQREASAATQRLSGIQGKRAEFEAERQALLDYEKLKQARHGAALEFGAQQADAQAKESGSLMSTLGTLGGAAIMMSDKNLKKDIKKADKEVKKFLDSIDAKKYKYKDESHGKGDQVGVMAQDLEKTEIGKQMIMETEAGKAVDYGKGFGAIVAAQAELNKRLKELEKKSKK